MEKNYNPSAFEQRIYDHWQSKKYFAAKQNKGKKPFTISMPPPNITGQLHIGHALDLSIQDAIIRYKRMKGFDALYMPGTDHASIATEVKIVDRLRGEGITKESLGREGFLKRAFEWKDEYGGRIVTQQQRLGLSCDWDRLSFTMDETRTQAVLEAFVRLYEKGLIYRGNRIINWCPCCKTALSDAEVEYKDADSHLWHVKYPLEDGSGFIVVATTRPETMLGDTAVAVNPKDSRYKKLVGKNLILPLVGTKIPIVADDYVEMGFGSGAVKITPAHDPNDFELGRRHNLPVIQVMDESAIMNENAGEFCGMTAATARQKVAEALEKQGFLLKTEDYKNSVGHCYRCDKTVEPLISEQWFVRMQPLAAPAVQAVKSGKIKFIPKRFEKMYLRWMENTRDWCISRQLWWGHRIPVYYCDKCGKMTASKTPLTVCACGGAVRQDEDVLDTWFSSALWPFATLGWPTSSADLSYFYPTNVLVTAYDIIGFWVSRMIFSGLEHTDKVPFDEVLIHGIVRDKDNKKMSKSSGNGVDPLEVIDTFGADVLRISLVNGISMGGDMKYSADKLEGYRNFMNKIWNASRFVLMNCESLGDTANEAGEGNEKGCNANANTALNVNTNSENTDECCGSNGCNCGNKAESGANNGGFTPLDIVKNKGQLTLADKWILSRLNRTTAQVTRFMDRYETGLAAAAIYDFFWSEFCDWYIEKSKGALYDGSDLQKRLTLSVLLHVLREALKLAHPIIPFITAEIYNQLPNKDAEDIMVSPFPTAKRSIFKAAAENMESVMRAIKDIRALRHEMNVSQSKRTAVLIVPAAGKAKLVERSAKYIQRLGYASSCELIAEKPDGKMAVIPSDIGEIYIPLGDLVDTEAELKRLNGELEHIESEITRAEGKLANQGFVAKAPPALIAAEKEKIAKYHAEKELISASIEKIKSM